MFFDTRNAAYNFNRIIDSNRSTIAEIHSPLQDLVTALYAAKSRLMIPALCFTKEVKIPPFVLITSLVSAACCSHCQNITVKEVHVVFANKMQFIEYGFR